MTSTSGAVVNGAEKVANQAEPEMNINDFMPSHQVLFRRSDGELLLPSVNPYQGLLQEAASASNSAASVAASRVNQQEIIRQQLNNYRWSDVLGIRELAKIKLTTVFWGKEE